MRHLQELFRGWPKMWSAGKTCKWIREYCRKIVPHEPVTLCALMTGAEQQKEETVAEEQQNTTEESEIFVGSGNSATIANFVEISMLLILAFYANFL